MPVPATQKDRAPLVEIFSSPQGEGPLVGCRQVFIRFCGCNLTCAYCDTNHLSDTYCRIETIPGSQQFRDVDNPVPLTTVTQLLQQWQLDFPGLHHSISLTGGEPLHHGALLRQWLPELHKILPVYLETNGTQPTILADLLPSIDMISMDIKLESVCNFATPWELHRSFLAESTGKLCCVKIVVDSNTTSDEISSAAHLVQELAPETALVIQPRTLNDSITITADILLQFQAVASSIHADVRIIPQTHRFLNLL